MLPSASRWCGTPCPQTSLCSVCFRVAGPALVWARRRPGGPWGARSWMRGEVSVTKAAACALCSSAGSPIEGGRGLRVGRRQAALVVRQRATRAPASHAWSGLNRRQRCLFGFEACSRCRGEQRLRLAVFVGHAFWRRSLVGSVVLSGRCTRACLVLCVVFGLRVGAAWCLPRKRGSGPKSAKLGRKVRFRHC